VNDTTLRIPAQFDRQQKAALKKAIKIASERLDDRRRPWSPARRRRQSAALREAWRLRKLHGRGQIMEPEKPEAPEPSDRSPVRAGQARFTDRGLLPAELREQHDTFKAAIYADLGGEDELTTIAKSAVENLAQVKTLQNLFLAEIARRGIVTSKGKVRSVVEAFFKATDRHDRLARLVGLERRTKRVTAGTIEEYLAAAEGAHSSDAPDGGDLSAQG
jgi:hypothetical protein